MQLIFINNGIWYLHSDGGGYSFDQNVQVFSAWVKVLSRQVVGSCMFELKYKGANRMDLDVFISHTSPMESCMGQFCGNFSPFLWNCMRILSVIILEIDF